jgi:hypothetical protein
MVSAFAARQRLVLGQRKVAEKSNEIVAIPKPLKLLAIEGAIITINAAGSQRGIAETVVEKKARLRACVEVQPGLTARECRAFRRRAESRWLPGRNGQLRPDGGRRSRSH